MRVLFHLFSGTGNTKRICELYKQAFEDAGHSVMLLSMDEQDLQPTVDYESYDLHGFFYPVYAFNTPQIVVNYIKKLPKMSKNKLFEPKRPCFIVTTSGEPLHLNIAARIKFKKAIKRHSMVICAQYNYLMPYNIMFRHSDERAYKMLNTARQLIPIEAKEIISLVETKAFSFLLPDIGIGERFASFVLRIESWGGRWLGRFYKATDACTKCGLCIRRCPVKNITADDDNKPVFGKKCLICQRCSMYCPTDAIKTGFLNSWKVNKPYSFEQPTEPAPTNDRSAKYLKSAYNKYFKEAEKKIKDFNDGLNEIIAANSNG